jgi:predicted SAM-dependent methyltransferase
MKNGRLHSLSWGFYAAIIQRQISERNLMITTPIRPISSYSKIRSLYSNFIRCKRVQLKNHVLEAKPYLNIGCGPNSIKDFINLDYMWLPGVDLVWDITKGIPFKNNKFSGIYSEHCLEHLSYQQAKFVLGEFFRLLNSTGLVRIVVPDAGLYLETYHRQKNGENISFPYGQTAHNIDDKHITSMMVVNSIFRGHGHLYAYDYETLKVLLESQGFIDVKQETFKHGREENLLVDSESRASESLYVEAVKP